MSAFTDKVTEFDNLNAVAEAISDDQFGNKRIAVLREQHFSTKRKVITLLWDIYTTDANGDLVEMKGLENPYAFHQAALTSTRVDPTTGEDQLPRDQDVNETDADYATYLDSFQESTVGEYDFLVSVVKNQQARFFDLVRGRIQEASTDGKI